MEVLNRQQIGLARFQPSAGGKALARGTMPIPATAVRYLSETALLALVNVPSQRRRYGRPRSPPLPDAGNDRGGRRWPRDRPHRGGGRHPPPAKRGEPRALAQPDGLNSGCGRISGIVSLKCSSGLFTAAMVLVA